MDIDCESKGKRIDKDNIRVKRKTLQALLDDCQRALELLNLAELSSEDDDDEEDKITGEKESSRGEVSSSDPEADELYDLIKSRVECHDFIDKIESAQVECLADCSSSWDVVSEDDLWDDESMAQSEEDYVLVREEDIAEGIACFIATYLSSLKQKKDLTPEQLQKALSRMFSVKKRKGKLRKAWDGSKVAYNVASWSATVIGIYQNPVILRVASKAFWASCHVISKLV
ncbi:PREDICTED: uncharacterized protein LOC104724236 isoform X2 [Camelina sativa]|uniref:Uncharacterized protein LOC104724236 isoform X2 n=1 Tax=Camelina sativa TaxID=90675 RepID=A0ABM0UGZ6_CAMSA|nr:PREDICTED: uncharacterized protein LOC104724236 isoform X2 [Camelina sativa]